MFHLFQSTTSLNYEGLKFILMFKNAVLMSHTAACSLQTNAPYSNTHITNTLWAKCRIF